MEDKRNWPYMNPLHDSFVNKPSQLSFYNPVSLLLPKWSEASMWHFLSKGQRWHKLSRKVSATSSKHAKMPSCKCQCFMFLVKLGDLLKFSAICFSRHFINKSIQARWGKKKWDRLEMNVITSGKRLCWTMCGKKMSLSLKSLSAVRHNTIRLKIVFPSPSAHLISALARLFSFICFIPLYCHNVADPECSHRSLLQLISEVVPLQIGSLNLVSLHSFSGLHFQGGKCCGEDR